MQPVRPALLSDYAEKTLRALADAGLGDRISLGGALGLQHYLDFRPTHDADAWWSPSATEKDRARVLQIVETVLQDYGDIRRRQWGDVNSVELRLGGRTVFSFQIANRSAQLEPTGRLPWTDVSLDSFPDLVASKMVALVERGAPRDFLDIYTVCGARLTTPEECWRLWRRRQQLAGSDVDPGRARLAVETHLARIAQHRPLDEIVEPESRSQAERLRAWFAKEFLDALVD
jgi:hypothetical protein